MLELEISAREKQYAGNTRTFRKRHLKELPISTREAIVKMYLVDHVFQNDIAKYYKVSAAMVSKLVVEAQRNPQKLKVLQVKKDEGKQVGEAV